MHDCTDSHIQVVGKLYNKLLLHVTDSLSAAASLCGSLCVVVICFPCWSVRLHQLLAQQLNYDPTRGFGMIRCLEMILRSAAAVQQLYGAAAKCPGRACPWDWKSQLPSCRQELRCALASSEHPCGLAEALGAPHCWPSLEHRTIQIRNVYRHRGSTGVLQTSSVSISTSYFMSQLSLLCPCRE